MLVLNQSEFKSLIIGNVLLSELFTSFFYIWLHFFTTVRLQGKV